MFFLKKSLLGQGLWTRQKSHLGKNHYQQRLPGNTSAAYSTKPGNTSSLSPRNPWEPLGVEISVPVYRVSNWSISCDGRSSWRTRRRKEVGPIKTRPLLLFKASATSSTCFLIWRQAKKKRASNSYAPFASLFLPA